MKGQMTIVGILMVFVTLLVFTTIVPTLQTTINNATQHTDGMTTLLLELIPFFIVIAIIMSVFTYARPTIERFRGDE